MSSPIRITRELRQKITPEEDFLWQILRNRGIKGKKVRRQHPLIYKTRGWIKYFYIADFCCASRKLIIELDGKHHEFGDQLEYDKARDAIINQMGLQIIRIKIDELLYDLEMVMKKIEGLL